MFYHSTLNSQFNKIVNANIPCVNPLESHTEDDGPRMVMNDEAIFVEVQQLRLE